MNKMAKVSGLGKCTLALALIGCSGNSSSITYNVVDQGGFGGSEIGAAGEDSNEASGAGGAARGGNASGGAAGSALGRAGSSSAAGRGGSSPGQAGGGSAAGAPAGGEHAGGAAGIGGVGRAFAGNSGVGGIGGQPGGGAAGAASGGTAGVSTCACSIGPCCDGCNLQPSTYLCATNQIHFAQCSSGGLSHSILYQYGDLYCSGSESSSCSRWVDTTYAAKTCPDSNDVCLNPLNGTPHCGPL